MVEVQKQKEQLEQQMHEYRRDDDPMKNRYFCFCFFLGVFLIICHCFLPSSLTITFFTVFLVSKNIMCTVGDCLHCRSNGFTSNFVKKARQIISVSRIHFHMNM